MMKIGKTCTMVKIYQVGRLLATGYLKKMVHCSFSPALAKKDGNVMELTYGVKRNTKISYYMLNTSIQKEETVEFSFELGIWRILFKKALKYKY